MIEGRARLSNALQEPDAGVCQGAAVLAKT